MNLSRVRFVGTDEEKLNYIKCLITERQKLLKHNGKFKDVSTRIIHEGNLESINKTLEKMLGE
jgi:hypothetical protein